MLNLILKEDDVVFRAIIFFTGIMLASSALADKILGVSAGSSWASGNKTQTFFLQSEVEKTYSADDNNTAFPAVEFL